MTTPNPMLAELDEVVRLMEAATPGEWYWNEYTANLVTDKPGDGQEFEIAAVYSEHDDDREPANSAAICAAMHFLRTHHATLADMAKDAARYRWLRDEADYAKKSAPAVMVHPLDRAKTAMVSGEHLDTVIDAAIDATQEGEG